MRPAKHMTPRE
jgi:hypothetical protein